MRMSDYLHDYLKKLWLESGLSHKEVADLVGLSVGGIRKALSGDRVPNVNTAYMLFYAFRSNFTEFETWVQTQPTVTSR